MGVLPTFIAWIKTLSTDVSSKVLLNGFLTVPITMESGI